NDIGVRGPNGKILTLDEAGVITKEEAVVEADQAEFVEVQQTQRQNFRFMPSDESSLLLTLPKTLKRYGSHRINIMYKQHPPPAFQNLITVQGDTVSNIVVDESAQQKLLNVPKGFTAVMENVPKSVMPRRLKNVHGNPQVFIDVQRKNTIMAEDISYARIGLEKGRSLIVQRESGTDTYGEKDFQKQEMAQADVLQTVANVPAMRALENGGDQVLGGVRSLQSAFDVGSESNMTQSYVNDVRGASDNLLAMYQSSGLKESAASIRQAITQLRAVNKGTYTDEVEQYLSGLEEKLQVIEQLISSKFIEKLNEEVHKNTFSPDSLATWWARNGVIIVSAIVIACLCASGIGLAAGAAGIAMTTATGAMTWTGLVVSSIGSGVGGYIGSEVGKELARTEFATFGNAQDDMASDLRLYKEGKIDGGEYVMSAIQQIGTNTAISFMLIGAGQAIGKWAQVQLASNAAGPEVIVANIVNMARNSLNVVDEAWDKLFGGAKGFFAGYMKEVGQEFYEEMVFEPGAELLLGPYLSKVAAALKCSGKFPGINTDSDVGVTVAEMRRVGNSIEQVCDYTNSDANRKQLLKEISENGGTTEVDPDTGDIIAEAVENGFRVKTTYRASAEPQLVRVLKQRPIGKVDPESTELPVTMVTEYNMRQNADGAWVYTHPGPGNLTLRQFLNNQDDIITLKGEEPGTFRVRIGAEVLVLLEAELDTDTQQETASKRSQLFPAALDPKVRYESKTPYSEADLLTIAELSRDNPRLLKVAIIVQQELTKSDIDADLRVRLATAVTNKTELPQVVAKALQTVHELEDAAGNRGTIKLEGTQDGQEVLNARKLKILSDAYMESDPRLSRTDALQNAKFLLDAALGGVTGTLEARRHAVVDGGRFSIDDIEGLTEQAEAAKEEESKQKIFEYYNGSPSVQDAQSRLESIISEQFPRDFAELKALTREVMTYYDQTDQYHNAEHMLQMTSDIFLLADTDKLTPESMRELLIAGLYHDVGNAEHPNTTAGVDELAAMTTFVDDNLAAKNGPLADLAADPSAVQRTAANILGTVFADRHASPEQLAKHEYVQEAAAYLTAQGIETTTEQLADLMIAPDALTVKNADLLGSLKKENAVINGLKNHSEDTRKDLTNLRNFVRGNPEGPAADLLARIDAGTIDAAGIREFIAPYAGKYDIFPPISALGKTPAQYKAGFDMFVAGKFHGFRNDGETDFSREAGEGNGLLSLPGDRSQSEQGAAVSAESSAYFDQVVQFDGEINSVMQDLLTEAAIASPQVNLIAMPIEQLAQRLSARMGASRFAPYQAHIDALSDGERALSISQMSPSQVNALFALQTELTVQRDAAELEIQSTVTFTKQEVNDLAQAAIRSIVDPEGTASSLGEGVLHYLKTVNTDPGNFDDIRLLAKQEIGDVSPENRAYIEAEIERAVTLFKDLQHGKKGGLDGVAEFFIQEGSFPIEELHQQSAIPLNTAAEKQLHQDQVQQLKEQSEVGLIQARNTVGATPEAIQEVAAEFVTQRIDMANAALTGDPVALATYITLLGGREKVAQGMAQKNEKRASKGKPEYATVEEFVQAEYAKEFVTITDAIARGEIGLDADKYIDTTFTAIRDLDGIMPGLDMEAKQALIRKLHTASMEKLNASGKHNFADLKSYLEWLMSPDQTIKGGRPEAREISVDEEVAMSYSQEASSRLNASIATIQGAETSAFTADATSETLAQVDNALDKAVLQETARILVGIETTAGARALPDAERWLILEFSATFLQDFRVANFGTEVSPQQLTELVVQNAVNLAHQNIMDHMTLVGSSHGTLHVLRGNSRMLMNMFSDPASGFTPEMRVLALQATFDHDMGYTKRTLTGSTEGQGVFAASKDHPLESTLRLEANKDQYVALFGQEGFVTLRNSILDHSDPVGKEQYADGRTKVDILGDPNASPAERVAAAVACVDCLATVSNLKASPLIRDNPEIMATMIRIQKIHTRIDAAKTSAEKESLQAEAKAIRLQLQDRIQSMDGLEQDAKDAIVLSLDATMTWEESPFAIGLNLQMLGATVDPDVRIVDGKPNVTYLIDPAGQRLIEDAVGPAQAEEIGEKGITKAAKDFGGLDDTNMAVFKEYMQHARHFATGTEAEHQSAREYFAATPNIVIETQEHLVITLALGESPQYAEVAQSVEKAVHIDNLRQFARQNIEKLIAGEALTITDAEGKKLEITDREEQRSTITESIQTIVEQLPKTYVIKSVDGKTDASLQSEYEAVQRAVIGMDPASAMQTWADFCVRIYTSAGSSSPIRQ
ncbi:MAG: hypothetical protein O2904_02030, partial [bacterium]|nr:hypothetical protein [bacterium]